jgi:hypothetical protein
MKTKRKNTFEGSTPAFIYHEDRKSCFIEVKTVRAVCDRNDFFVPHHEYICMTVNKCNQNTSKYYIMLTWGGNSLYGRGLFAAMHGAMSYGAVRFCKPDSQFTDSKIQGFKDSRVSGRNTPYLKDTFQIVAPVRTRFSGVRSSRIASHLAGTTRQFELHPISMYMSGLARTPDVSVFLRKNAGQQQLCIC